MKQGPLRLLLVAYGAAALIGAGLAPVVGVVGGLILFWIGGAVLTVALAVTPGLRAPFRTERAEDGAGYGVEKEAAAMAEALRRWEEDRLADRTASDDEAKAG